MPILMTALVLGAISMLIVIFSGLTSGLVRLGTLSLRALFAFAMTSAASYFLMMLFDLYDEYINKKPEPVVTPEEVSEQQAEESPAEETPAEETLAEGTPVAAGFEPLKAKELPNIAR